MNDRTAPDAFLGQQVANFHIDELIKEGEVSRIYRGRDVIQRRPVAVKVLLAQDDNEAHVEHFLREARGMMSAWWHQHITRIYYAAKRDGRSIIVMEYVNGPNLRELLNEYADSQELIPVDDVIRIGRAVADALDYAHQRGVIHRDVKPSNILVCMDGRILLTDFGLARPIARPSDKTTFGTPAYIAPEQIKRPATIDYKADLYSLAAMLYEMLAGRPPFIGETAEAVLQQHLSALPPKPSFINPHLNPAVDAVLERGLAKVPTERYSSGVALIDALEKGLGAAIEVLTDQGEMPPLPAVIQKNVAPAPVVSPVSVVDKIASQLEMDGSAVSQTAENHSRRRRMMLGCWGSLVLVATLLVAGAYFMSHWWPSVMAAPTVVAIAPSATVTTTATAVSSVTPTATAIIVVVTAVMPTSTITPSPSPTPTATATPTATPVPPTPTVTTTPTASFTGAPVRFFYGRYSFYMLNPAEEPLDSGAVTFQALDRNEEPMDEVFRGRDWSVIYRELESGHCNAIELMDAPSLLRPQECSAYNVTLTPPLTYSNAFWLPEGGNIAFRVFWNGHDIGTCPIVAGVCQLQLP